MKHEYTSPVTLSGQGALTTRRVSFCKACGVLRTEIANVRSGRSSFLYAFTQTKGDTLLLMSEPTCSLSAERRTRIVERDRVARAHVGNAGALLVALRDSVSRDEWRAMCDAAGLLHVSRYRPTEAGKRSADLYGPVPVAWCGVALGLVSWTTIGLSGEPDRFEEGDAICVDCWEKSGPTRKRDRARAPMLP